MFVSMKPKTFGYKPIVKESKELRTLDGQAPGLEISPRLVESDDFDLDQGLVRVGTNIWFDMASNISDQFLTFCLKAVQVEELRTYEDPEKFFEAATRKRYAYRVQWEDVEFFSIRSPVGGGSQQIWAVAPSVERLVEALKHVYLVCYDREFLEHWGFTQ